MPDEFVGAMRSHKNSRNLQGDLTEKSGWQGKKSAVIKFARDR